MIRRIVTFYLAVANILSLNMLASIPATFEANGNLTSDGTRTFQYDAENELTNVYMASAWQVGFIYDGLHRRRITKQYTWQSGAFVETNDIRYVYDGLTPIQERDTNNNVVATYTHGLDLSLSLSLGGAGGIGGLLSKTDSTGSYFYNSDGIGNITALVDANGNIQARAEYDGFGKMIKLTGSMAGKNNYWASSKEYIPQAGIYGFGYRFYEPNFQRWLNRDPIGELGGPNLYGFVGNNPVNIGDPYGLNWLLFDPQAWGQLAHDAFIGDHTQNQHQVDPNSLQGLEDGAGVGITPLTDANGDQITPNQALGQMAQDAVSDAAQLAMMAGLPEGEFSVADWEGYPKNLPKPKTPCRVLKGPEYENSRKAANAANRAIHEADPSLAGKQIHEIQPVKFGGDPTDPANKIPLSPDEHQQVSSWWNNLLQYLKGN